MEITFGVVIAFFFVLCIGALLWWGVGRLTLPEPVKTIALVLIGLVLIYFLWNVVTGDSVNFIR